MRIQVIVSRLCFALLATLFVSVQSTGLAEEKKVAPDKKVDAELTSAVSELTSNIPETAWADFRNGSQQRGVAKSKLPEKLELLWQVTAPDGWVATPAIVNDRVYAPSLSGYLYCLDKNTGKELWKYRSIKNPDPQEFAPGFKATPKVTNDTIYIGDEDGFIHAVDRASGKQKWLVETSGEISGCAAVVKDRIIVGSHDSFLYCLTPEGKIEWKIQTEDRINCSAAVVENFTFVTGCDAQLRVIDISAGKEVSVLPLDSYLIASPAIRNNMLYVGSQDGEVFGVNWKESKIVWRFKDPDKLQPFHASAAVTDDYVFVGSHDKHMYCLNRETGKEVWKFKTRAQINSSPVVVGNRVFFGSNDGNARAVDIKTAKEVWKYNAGKDLSSGFAVGESVLVFGEEAPGAKGKLHCFGRKK